MFDFCAVKHDFVPARDHNHNHVQEQKQDALRIPDEFSLDTPNDLCLMSWCSGCERDLVTDCSRLYCGACTEKVFCRFCEQCDNCCSCPERKLLGKVEELVRQADSKLLAEIYKALTHTENFEYQGYRKLVSVDIVCDGTVKWFVKGESFVDGKEVSATFDNVTLEEVLESEIGQELNLIRGEVFRGLGWHDCGTFWGSPPHVEATVLRITS